MPADLLARTSRKSEDLLMFIKDLSQLVEELGKAIPSAQFDLHMDTIWVNDGFASIQLRSPGYLLTVPRFTHSGHYTDFAMLAVELQTLLRVTNTDRRGAYHETIQTRPVRP
jgi:hypothetical protein